LDENEAHRAFAREVAVYLETRIVNSLNDPGALDR
jgi:hypothetical protein